MQVIERSIKIDTQIYAVADRQSNRYTDTEKQNDREADSQRQNDRGTKRLGANAREAQCIRIRPAGIQYQSYMLFGFTLKTWFPLLINKAAELVGAEIVKRHQNYMSGTRNL